VGAAPYRRCDGIKRAQMVLSVNISRRAVHGELYEGLASVTRVGLDLSVLKRSPWRLTNPDSPM
jgi:hypothetical protein